MNFKLPNNKEEFLVYFKALEHMLTGGSKTYLRNKSTSAEMRTDLLNTGETQVQDGNTWLNMFDEAKFSGRYTNYGSISSGYV